MLVGILNTIVGYGSYVLLIYFGVYYLLANVLSTIIGTAHSYVWNKFFTFKSKKKSFSELIRFLIVYAVQFFINIGLLKVLVDFVGMNKMLAGIPTLFVTTLISFLGHKYFSFRQLNQKKKDSI